MCIALRTGSGIKDLKTPDFLINGEEQLLTKKIHIWLVALIIFCSTAGYKISALGQIQDVLVLLGIAIILVSIILRFVYSKEKSVPHHFNLPISLIFLALLTSMLMAFSNRDQSLGETLYAQHAIYYYLFYVLLHQLKIEIKDLERIFIAFGILYVFLFLLQFFAYPTILFDAYIRPDRGTVRIYLPGTDYLFISFFFGVQYFFRTNKMKYLLLLLGIATIFVLTGGRQTMATVVLIVVFFILFDRKIKSKFLLSVVGVIGALAVYIIFQSIFEALLLQSKKDLQYGDNYVRFRAAEYYLTDFYKSPWAYLTGNGMYRFGSGYGNDILFNMEKRRYFLGDIGIIGNYAIYGPFFVIGVLMICYRALKIKIQSRYFYLKLMFLSLLLSLIIAEGFALSSTICFVVIMLYMIDVSNAELENSA